MYTTHGLEVQGLEINESVILTRQTDRSLHFDEDKLQEHYHYKKEVVYANEQMELSVTMLFNTPCADE
jgi:hypothetical protein